MCLQCFFRVKIWFFSYPLKGFYRDKSHHGIFGLSVPASGKVRTMCGFRGEYAVFCGTELFITGNTHCAGYVLLMEILFQTDFLVTG